MHFIIEKQDLRAKDLKKESSEDWYLSQNTVAISLYVDLFADNLKGMQTNIAYLKELASTSFISCHYFDLAKEWTMAVLLSAATLKLILN